MLMGPAPTFGSTWKRVSNSPVSERNKTAALADSPLSLNERNQSPNQYQHAENLVGSIDTGNAYNAQQRTDLYKRVLDRLEDLPGANSATLLYFSLLSGNAISYNIAAPEFSAGPEVNTEFL